MVLEKCAHVVLGQPGGGVRHGDHRPLLDDDPEGVLDRLNQERLDRYAEVADAVIDVDELDLDEVAARVLEEIAG